MKVVLAGYYGSGNLGDDAILEALVGGLKRLFLNIDITVLSGNPHATEECFNVHAVKRFSFLSTIRAIRKSDAFILGGGGLLQDSTSSKSLLYYLFLIFIAKLFKKKTILLGQGIGPLKRTKLLKYVVKEVDLITVRDEESAKILTLLKVQAKKMVVTADLSFLLEMPDQKVASKLMGIEGIQKCRQLLIGASLRQPVGSSFSDSKIKEIASFCDRLIKEKDCQIVFLIFKYPEDMEITQKVIGLMKYPAHIFLRQCKPSDMLAVVSKMDAVIGMRLHSLIFSSISGVPAFGLSYDPKIASFQKIVGNPWLDIGDLSEQNLMREVSKFLDNLTKPSYEIQQLIQKSQTNITLLKECLLKNKINIQGIEIDNMSMKEAMGRVDELLKSRNHLIVTPNPEIIIAAQKDVELKHIINNASLVLADGVGLIIAARILGKKFKQRVTGIDFMLKIVEYARNKGLKIFLLGGREGVAEKAAAKLHANVVGTYHGYSKNDQLVIDMIKKAKPDILFIGLGFPKQEKWASKYLRELNVPLVMCIGGSLDVIAGKVWRAPLLMRIAGLEWLWRLMLEPRRWRRMLNLPLFLFKVISSRFVI